MSAVRGFEGSLFERVREAAKPSVRRKPKAVLLHSILDNLQNILNTRTGSCYGSPALGVPDLNDESLATQNIRDVTAQMVRNCILRYEPRISDAIVTTKIPYDAAPQTLNFHITAYLDFYDRQDVLEFDILLDNSQHWRVKE
ncbi:type VI secretion system baseplate subunit TssE [Salmonella enterica]|nr:type VI secretion system baseplate subunit TssE [Salmonella enterica]EAX6603501.1 type VI secretion system baseplate subunit TssE [Salmonella enterica]